MQPIYTKRFFRCDCGPDGDEFGVEHLLARIEPETTAFGPWRCGACGGAWSGRVANGQIVALERAAEPERHIGVLLKLDYEPSRDGPIYVVVDAPTQADSEQWDSSRFLFEEHQCPINILRKAAKIYVGGDDDRHGLFRLEAIANEDFPDDSPDLDDYVERNFGETVTASTPAGS